MVPEKPLRLCPKAATVRQCHSAFDRSELGNLRLLVQLGSKCRANSSMTSTTVTKTAILLDAFREPLATAGAMLSTRSTVSACRWPSERRWRFLASTA